MMDSAKVSAIAKRVILALKSKKAELERKLGAMKECHKRAWETYGIELSYGDMIAREISVQDKIERASKDIELMEGVISVRIDEKFIRDSEEAQLRHIAKHNEKIAKIAEDKKNNETLLEEVRRMKAMLQID